MRREGRFIKAHKLSDRRIGFHQAELDDWLKHRALA
jgi:predicted DNA-binding transcriptional regulator AlpA